MPVPALVSLDSSSGRVSYAVSVMARLYGRPPRALARVERLARAGVDHLDGAGRAVAGGLQDQLLGGAGRVDYLRLPVVVVAKDLGGEEDALAVPDAEVVVNDDAERRRCQPSWCSAEELRVIMEAPFRPSCGCDRSRPRGERERARSVSAPRACGRCASGRPARPVRGLASRAPAARRPARHDGKSGSPRSARGASVPGDRQGCQRTELDARLVGELLGLEPERAEPLGERAEDLLALDAGE